MPTYKQLALIAIFFYAALYTFTSPVTNDSYAHAKMALNGDEAYPPLFYSLVKTEMLIVGANQENALMMTFITGSLLTLVILPFFVFKLFEEYTKNAKIAFWSFFAYLFALGVTNYYYYANIWAQVLAMIFIVIATRHLLRKEELKAIIFVSLTFIAHREMCWYAVLIYVAFAVMNRIKFENVSTAFVYCLYKSGEIVRSSTCYIPMFLIVYPAFWLFTLRNAVWKTNEDKLYLFASVVPLAFAFVDLRVLLATFTFWSVYIGTEMTKGNKRLILLVLFSILFTAFSFFYTLDLANTAIS
jgi:hypothetical protein